MWFIINSQTVLSQKKNGTPRSFLARKSKVYFMKQDINRHDILEKITPLIENTAMRFGYIPIEIEFVKENHRWFLRIYLYSKDKLYKIILRYIKSWNNWWKNIPYRFIRWRNIIHGRCKTCYTTRIWKTKESCARSTTIVTINLH